MEINACPCLDDLLFLLGNHLRDLLQTILRRREGGLLSERVIRVRRGVDGREDECDSNERDYDLGMAGSA